ncbi:MAG: hypothetical protein CMK70_15885 [Pseudohongiella sp.]|nr:hypothetical protein [Pseudohongiella sp.]|tara:strand:+ start:7325 stop:8353 length:1029 start_codon:yes stop_codon:yes gene_type:complete
MKAVINMDTGTRVKDKRAMSHTNISYATTLHNTFLLGYLDHNTGTSATPSEARQRVLYELANARVWNVQQHIDWDMSKRSSAFPECKSDDPLDTYPPYQSLSREQRHALSWLRHAMELSDILHGEQAALLLSAQLLSVVPNAAARLFMSSQVSDEARHVDFFTQYMVAAKLPVSPPNDQLARLIHDALQSPDWRYKFSVCQVLIESLALARFRELKSISSIPALQQGLALILQDEARHVKFGTDTLHEAFTELTPEERELRGSHLLHSALLLIDTTHSSAALAREVRWDAAHLRLHLRQYRIRHPEIARQRLRQLSLNMSSAGLMTDNIRKRLERITNPTNS